MFIAARFLTNCALQRSAMCLAEVNLHSAPDGAGLTEESKAINILLLRSKP